MQTETPRPAPAFDLATLFALKVKPVADAIGAHYTKRVNRAVADLEDLGLDLLDLCPITAIRDGHGFGPAAREMVPALAYPRR